jgi:GNAT superfamily N-acetyltransferase
MMAIDIVVRPVRLSDAVDLRDNCFSMNALEEVQSRIRTNLRTLEEGSGLQLVAEVDGRVVGTVALNRHTHPLFAHRAQVDDVVVHGDYQRRGIARRLVAELRNRAQAMGVEILEVSCRAGTAAEQVYPRLGFIEYGRLPRGIKEPWGDYQVFDMVYLYQPLEPGEGIDP